MAIDRLGGAVEAICCKGTWRVHVATVLGKEEDVACLQSCHTGFRNAIVEGRIVAG